MNKSFLIICATLLSQVALSMPLLKNYEGNYECKDEAQYSPAYLGFFRLKINVQSDGQSAKISFGIAKRREDNSTEDFSRIKMYPYQDVAFLNPAVNKTWTPVNYYPSAVVYQQIDAYRAFTDPENSPYILENRVKSDHQIDYMTGKIFEPGPACDNGYGSARTCLYQATYKMSDNNIRIRGERYFYRGHMTFICDRSK